MATPLIFAALGGMFSERSGVVNIALEGILLTGAFASILVTYQTGDPWLGAFAGLLAGVLVSAIHAVVSITFKANQIVSGVAINLLAMGATQFLTWIIWGSSANSPPVEGMSYWALPESWGAVARAVNVVIGHYPPLVYIAFASVVIAHVTLWRTAFGLRLRAVGEHPEAADTLGINVHRLRYAGVLLSGALAGLGGAFLALNTHQFVKNMSAGRGFIALAAMIFGKWNPVGALFACLLFGYAEAVQMGLQGRGIPSQFVQMIPYVLTMVALVGVIGRARPPAASGKPY
ncbi:MAG: ABC transporter permease [Candidatus Eisenbacteria bacterium]|nr:ABC transporter permease [Candidatus Eisenbacteria bacterium]